jgi:hypothetical protein
MYHRMLKDVSSWVYEHAVEEEERLTRFMDCFTCRFTPPTERNRVS